jgi:hypothetical protein
MTYISKKLPQQAILPSYKEYTQTSITHFEKIEYTNVRKQIIIKKAQRM